MSTPDLTPCPYRIAGRDRCPSAEELEGYAAHTLPPLAAMDLFEQLERCPTCRMVVEEHLSDPDPPEPDPHALLGQANVAVLIEAPDPLSPAAQRVGRDVLAGGFSGVWSLAPDGRAGVLVVPVGTGRFAGAMPSVDSARLKMVLNLAARMLPRVQDGLRAHVACEMGRATLESGGVDRVVAAARASRVARGAGVWLAEDTAQHLPSGALTAGLGAQVEGWRPVSALELSLAPDPAPASGPLAPRTPEGRPALGWRGERPLPRMPGLVPALLVIFALLGFLLLFSWLWSHRAPSDVRLRVAPAASGSVEVLVDAPPELPVQVFSLDGDLLQWQGARAAVPAGQPVERAIPLRAGLPDLGRLFGVVGATGGLNGEAVAARVTDELRTRLVACSNDACRATAHQDVPDLLRAAVQAEHGTPPTLVVEIPMTDRRGQP